MSGARPLADIVRSLPALRAAARFPAEPVASYPLPVLEAEAPAWFVFFCPWQGAPPAPITLFPPMGRFWLGADGTLRRAAAATPADFGQSMPPRTALGTHRYDPPIRMDEYLALEERMHLALDVLLPYAGRWPAEPQEAVAAAALAWHDDFARIAQPPLLPFYRAAAPELFAWVERCAETVAE